MMPSLFAAHGAPTLAVENNAYTRFLRKLAGDLPKPKAVVLVSAHWESRVQLVSVCERYDMIYDFYGFPEEMYRIVYPAQGEPRLAESILKALGGQGIASEPDGKRGLDHGAWVVLRLLYPDADVPVVAMSVNPWAEPRELYRIGRTLADLRKDGVLIVGSGGTVHNLRQLDWRSGKASDWAVAFDDWLAGKLEAWDTEGLFGYIEEAPFGRQAVPTPEHFVPLLYAMGAADDRREAKRLFREYQYGSLSLSCWRFG